MSFLRWNLCRVGCNTKCAPEYIIFTTDRPKLPDLILSKPEKGGFFSLINFLASSSHSAPTRRDPNEPDRRRHHHLLLLHEFPAGSCRNPSNLRPFAFRRGQFSWKFGKRARLFRLSLSVLRLGTSPLSLLTPARFPLSFSVSPIGKGAGSVADLAPEAAI